MYILSFLMPLNSLKQPKAMRHYRIIAHDRPMDNGRPRGGQ
jgi:hypothetical protein